MYTEIVLNPMFMKVIMQQRKSENRLDSEIYIDTDISAI